MQILKNFNFWKKFSKYLLIGLSAFVLFFAFQGAPNPIFATHSCSVSPSAVNIVSPSNNQSFPIGAANVTVQWNFDSNVDSYRITVTDNTINSTTVSTSTSGNSYNVPVQDSHSYTVLIVPGNGCGNGAGSQVSFMVGSSQQSCQGVPSRWCPDRYSDDEGYYAEPDPNNNCQVSCGGFGGGGSSTGAFNCYVSQSPLYAQGSVNYRYSLAAQSDSTYSISSYQWDINNNGSIDSSSSSFEYDFPVNASTPVRLTLFNSINQSCTVTTTITPSFGGTGTVPSCTIYASPQSGPSPLYVNFSANAQAYSGRNISNYRWDLDGDGSYDDDYDASSSKNYYDDTTVRLQVTDNNGSSGYCTTFIDVTNFGGYPTPPYNYPTPPYNYPTPPYYPTPPNNQCTYISCTEAPVGCYYQNQRTSSCDSYLPATCGDLICSPSIDFPSFPGNGLTGQTVVDITNTNINENNNHNYVSGSEARSLGGSTTVNIRD